MNPYAISRAEILNYERARIVAGARPRVYKFFLPVIFAVVVDVDTPTRGSTESPEFSPGFVLVEIRQ